MAISKNDVLEYISGLSVLELSELVKEFEEKFGVSAAPVVVAGAAGGAAGGAADLERAGGLRYDADAPEDLPERGGERRRRGGARARRELFW